MEFRHPDRCVVGTLGVPGNRVFLIQVTQGQAIVAVVVEKEQAQLLGRRLDDMLDGLADIGQAVPERHEPRDLGPLDAPVSIDFRAGAIGLAWDGEHTAAQIELFGMETATDLDPEFVQIWLTPAQAREFAARAEFIVRAGRPACPVCSQPLDPGGHICPRANGYRAHLFA